ncbi:hypothetical protein LTR27_011452 [Elasticomyces elasticus]|nr:hypothetical protein LTR27_011452 [Elasticomyces elasticus]
MSSEQLPNPIKKQQYHTTIMASTQRPTEQNLDAMGPASRVFAIPELLEMILIHLKNTLQLFVLRRVNNTFYDILKDSKILRCYLMIRDPKMWGEITFNPALRSVEEMDKAWYPMDFQRWNKSKLQWHLEIDWWGGFWGNEKSALSHLADQPMCAQASWREILLFEDGDLAVELFMPNDESEPWYDFEAEGGATMGWVVDHYAAELRREARSYFMARQKHQTDQRQTQQHHDTTIMSTTTAFTKQQPEVIGAAAEVFTMPGSSEVMNLNNTSYLTTRQAMATAPESIEEMRTAAAKVIAIPGLLEMILQPLHTTLQLFTLRRVNSTFQAIIEDSKSLRCPPIGSKERHPCYNAIRFPNRMAKFWYPMQISRFYHNFLRLDLQAVWRQDVFEVDKAGAVARLVDQPMLDPTSSWRELRLFEDDDFGEGEVEIILPRRRVLRQAERLKREVPEGATMGWFVECYAAELRKLLDRETDVRGHYSSKMCS